MNGGDASDADGNGVRDAASVDDTSDAAGVDCAAETVGSFTGVSSVSVSTAPQTMTTVAM